MILAVCPGRLGVSVHDKLGEPSVGPRLLHVMFGIHGQDRSNPTYTEQLSACGVMDERDDWGFARDPMT